MSRSLRYTLWALVFLGTEIALMTWVDRPVSDAMRTLDATHPGIINFFRAITDYAKSKWYLWPAAFGIATCFAVVKIYALNQAVRLQAARLGHHLAFLFASIALSGILTDTLKPIFGRARPVEMLRDGLYGFHPFTFHASMNGMPSGHATTAAALAAVLCTLLPRQKPIWLMIGMILAASRVMVNAHYLSDVLAGAAIGLGTTLFLARLRHKGNFPLINGIFPIDSRRRIS